MFFIIISGKTQDGKDVKLNVSGVEYKNVHCLKKFKWLTPDLLDTYIELCKQGVDYNQIARTLGVSSGTIHTLKKEIGINNRFNKKTQDKYIKFLLDNNVLTHDVELILGISGKTVFEVANKFGKHRLHNPEYSIKKIKNTEYLIKLKKLMDAIYD